MTAPLNQLNLPAAMRLALERCYETPPRAYHNLDHVAEVLGRWREVNSHQGWRQPLETSLALVHHDAIYVVAAKDNEARSAALARAVIARWLPQRGIDAERVAQLIEWTALHGQLKPQDIDPEARLVLDCDMAILGSSPKRFTQYCEQIAEEYREQISADEYKRGRAAFLAGLLSQDRIFLSDFFHQRLDSKARRNLRTALAQHGVTSGSAFAATKGQQKT